MDLIAEIKYVRKSNQPFPCQRIVSIGGKLIDGSTWEISQDEAIQYIENNCIRFCVNVSGYRSFVIVANSITGKKYIKTELDGIQPENLLKLPGIK